MKEKVDELKNTLDDKTKTVLIADSGYHSELEILKVLEDKASELFIPHPLDVKVKERLGKEKKGLVPAKGYKTADFKYNRENDSFTCPAGKTMVRQKGKGYLDNGVRRVRYLCKDCKSCKSRVLCTKSKTGRAIVVSVNFSQMENFRKKMTSNLGKKVIAKRKEIVEHPFGTIKRTLGFTYFMQKGLENVKAEFGFIAFIYNFKRLINIVGPGKLMELLM